jgi:hypothetical protein
MGLFHSSVCRSYLRVAGRASRAGGLSDGQTNGIKIIPFVCLSQVRVAKDGLGEFVDGQTIGQLTGEFVDGHTIGQLTLESGGFGDG